MNNQNIDILKLQSVSQLLDKLETKPKLELIPDERLFNLKPKINLVLRLGYTYFEISQVLKEKKINISPEKLKKYMAT